jgi:hypothetical protein
MRRLTKLIRKLEFTEDQRRNVTLGTNVRMDPELGHLVLKRESLRYPTTADLFARSQRINPASAKRWIGFQCQCKTPKGEDGSQATSIGFRLSRDGVEQLWWDGVEWSPAGAGDWNTETEVATNISELAVDVRGMQAVINLRTTDYTVSPTVEWIKFLYESDIDSFEEDYSRSLAGALRSGIRPSAEYQSVLDSDSSQIELSANPGIDTAYRILSIDSVYDLTSDPDRLTELVHTWDPGTGRIQLDQTFPSGTHFGVRFLYEPLVVISAVSQEYTEVARVPAVIIGNMNLLSMQQAGAEDFVINKGTGKGWKVQMDVDDVEFDITWITSKTLDSHRLSSKIRAFFAESQLRSIGQDDLFDMRITNDFAAGGPVGQNEIQDGRLRVRIYRALFSRRDAVEVNAVLRFTVIGKDMSTQ